MGQITKCLIATHKEAEYILLVWSLASPWFLRVYKKTQSQTKAHFTAEATRQGYALNLSNKLYNLQCTYWLIIAAIRIKDHRDQVILYASHAEISIMSRMEWVLHEGYSSHTHTSIKSRKGSQNALYSIDIWRWCIVPLPQECLIKELHE